MKKIHKHITDSEVVPKQIFKPKYKMQRYATSHELADKSCEKHNGSLVKAKENGKESTQHYVVDSLVMQWTTNTKEKFHGNIIKLQTNQVFSNLPGLPEFGIEELAGISRSAKDGIARNSQWKPTLLS
jgi:hypothetical protein